MEDAIGVGIFLLTLHSPSDFVRDHLPVLPPLRNDLPPSFLHYHPTFPPSERLRGGFSLEWGVFTLAAHSGRRLAAGRLAPTVRLHAFHRSLAEDARNLLHIASSSLWSTPYSCGPLSGRVIRSRSLRAHLGEKSPLEWDLIHYAGHRPGILAAHYRPSAHSLPLSRHILRNTHLRALSLQQGPSRAARRRRASTRIFAIFDHSPLYERHGQKSE